MFIKSRFIFTESGEFKSGVIKIENGKIKELVWDFSDMEVGCEEVIDACEMFVIPGLVDIHLHGCNGADFCDATFETYSAIEEYQLNHGITTAFPATMTLPLEELRGIFKTAKKYAKQNRDVICGITMEGPFISENKKGAQPGEYIQKPDIEIYKEMQELSGGLIKQVTVAPEETRALGFISEMSKEVVVSLAHTEADYQMAEKAFDNGATHVTHLFNGMNPFSHREPGVVGAAFDNKDVFVELICDGVHIHPSMVRAVFKMFGAERICMISDSMRATGMQDGEYTLGGQRVSVQGKLVTLADGTIAGSACDLHQCLKTVVKEMNIPLNEAVLACTKTPAKSLGVDDKCGVLAEGRNADILIMDKELNICYVIKNGEMLNRENATAQ